MSAAGSRKAICTLRGLFAFSAATRREPFSTRPRAFASVDLRLTYALPAGLAHQSASALSFLNLGISAALFLAGIVFNILRRAIEGNRGAVLDPNRSPLLLA